MKHKHLISVLALLLSALLLFTGCGSNAVSNPSANGGNNTPDSSEGEDTPDTPTWDDNNPGAPNEEDGENNGSLPDTNDPSTGDEENQPTATLTLGGVDISEFVIVYEMPK